MTISPVQAIHPLYELFAKGIYSYFGGGQSAVIDQLRSAGYSIDKEFNDLNTSFQALGLIYKDGTRPPVLIFQGSVDNKDFIEDANPQGVGFNQFTANKDAVRSWLTTVIADKTKNPSGLKVDFTGHSLGAALTQWFASEYPNLLREAITFQSPGITQAASDGFVSKGGTASQITHYAVNGDIVSLAGVAFLPGTLKLTDYQTVANDPGEYLTKHVAGILNGTIPSFSTQTVDTVLSTTLSQFNASNFSYTGQDWQDFISRVKAGNPDLGQKAENRSGSESQRIASGSLSDVIASINQALTTINSFYTNYYSYHSSLFYTHQCHQSQRVLYYPHCYHVDNSYHYSGQLYS
jgi:serralysin